MNDSNRSVLAQGIDAFAGIVRFRKGPEDVPASAGLLTAVIAGVIALRFLLLALPVPGAVENAEATRNPVVLFLLEVGILMLGVQVALRLAAHPERFLQTITAIFGSQVLLAPAWIGSRWMLLNWYNHPSLASVAWFVVGAVGVWMFVIAVRILRAATEWPLVASILLALTIEMLTLLATLSLYPPEAAPAAA